MLVLWKQNFSDMFPLNTGVPQGSSLGPLLFPLYVTPLSAVISSFGVSHHQHHQYADDLPIYFAASGWRIGQSRSATGLHSRCSLFATDERPSNAIQSLDQAADTSGLYHEQCIGNSQYATSINSRYCRCSITGKLAVHSLPVKCCHPFLAQLFQGVFPIKADITSYVAAALEVVTWEMVWSTHLNSISTIQRYQVHYKSTQQFPVKMWKVLPQTSTVCLRQNNTCHVSVWECSNRFLDHFCSRTRRFRDNWLKKCSHAFFRGTFDSFNKPPPHMTPDRKCYLRWRNQCTDLHSINEIPNGQSMWCGMWMSTKNWLIVWQKWKYVRPLLYCYPKRNFRQTLREGVNLEKPQPCPQSKQNRNT